ncbi:MAG: nSTAND1 domain-containing NTPase, partial [Kofleriaceae bacterium]
GELLGRGGCASVYRARQLAVERDVAIKVLHADIDPSSEDGRLFVHEIRSVGRIDHANVVRIHQADITHDGRLFFAMELLDGSDLQQLGAAGVMSRERAVELVRQLLAGLGAAHAAGLVHADVKPANAIVVPRGRGAEPGAMGGAPDDEPGERLVLADFGLARLRSPDRPAESAGGTPAYMAPEQLHEGRVDARSDLFSAALVLVFLLTGWRRPNAVSLVPPLDGIADPELRAVLARALDLDPAKRFQSARELSDALIGHSTASSTSTERAPIVPFRHLAPLTELDRGRLHGREADLAELTEHALFRRSVVYTAPSGTGKTSTLRAGLIPRLEALGIDAIYLRCRKDTAAALAAEISPGASSIDAAIVARHQQGGGKLVLILDQLEAALVDPDFIPAVLGFDRWPADVDVSIVLSIREDYLARLLARTQELEAGIPIVRLPPLSPEGARAAIVAPLTESRLAIEPELLDALLIDLQRAGAALGPELGWGGVSAIYPPHLQLACSVLYEALGPGEATITLAHYRRQGGFEAIVGEHLERVLDTELADGRDIIARDLFFALVTTAHERAMLPESELLAIVGAKHPADRVTAVLEVLRSRGLLVRVRGTDEPGWELIHDSLVPRVLAWIDARDLARRRAIELVRYHLRRSKGDEPSLLDRSELRELREHVGAIEELDAEWKQRDPGAAWTPRRLVARSKQILRRQFVLLAIVVSAALAVGIVGWYRSREAERRSQLDLGEFVLVLKPFDWDAEQQQPIWVDASRVPLEWNLYAPDREAMDRPGAEFPSAWVSRGARELAQRAFVQHVEARGGEAFLVVSRGDCPASVVPIRRLPGNADRAQTPPVIEIGVPTCQASFGDAIEVPAGPFLYRGTGEPPSSNEGKEQRVELPRYRIDRLEVSNAAYEVFGSMEAVTGFRRRTYPSTPQLGVPDGPRKPVSGITWTEARAYCRFLGKRLPTSQEWEKAMRGGERLADGSLNLAPRRTLPWGDWQVPVPAHIKGTPDSDISGPADVGSHAGDRSPYGVLDLAGNVSEWVETAIGPGFRIIRGGNWGVTVVTTPSDVDVNSYYLGLVDSVSDESNQRDERQIEFLIGMRCGSSE